MACHSAVARGERLQSHVRPCTDATVRLVPDQSGGERNIQHTGNLFEHRQPIELPIPFLILSTQLSDLAPIARRSGRAGRPGRRRPRRRARGSARWRAVLAACWSARISGRPAVSNSCPGVQELDAQCADLTHRCQDVVYGEGDAGTMVALDETIHVTPTAASTPTSGPASLGCCTPPGTSCITSGALRSSRSPRTPGSAARSATR